MNLGPVRLFVLDANLTTVTGRSFHVSPGSYNAPVPGGPSADLPLPYNEAWTTFHLVISLAKIMRSTVGTLVRPPLPPSPSVYLTWFGDYSPPAFYVAQYSLDSSERTSTWFVIQMKALQAEVDVVQQAIPPESVPFSQRSRSSVMSSSRTIEPLLTEVHLIHPLADCTGLFWPHRTAGPSTSRLWRVYRALPFSFSQSQPLSFSFVLLPAPDSDRALTSCRSTSCCKRPVS